MSGENELLGKELLGKELLVALAQMSGENELLGKELLVLETAKNCGVTEFVLEV